jgi:hypothetical protein
VWPGVAIMDRQRGGRVSGFGQRVRGLRGRSGADVDRGRLPLARPRPPARVGALGELSCGGFAAPLQARKAPATNAKATDAPAFSRRFSRRVATCFGLANIGDVVPAGRGVAERDQVARARGGRCVHDGQRVGWRRGSAVLVSAAEDAKDAE